MQYVFYGHHYKIRLNKEKKVILKNQSSWISDCRFIVLSVLYKRVILITYRGTSTLTSIR